MDFDKIFNEVKSCFSRFGKSFKSSIDYTDKSLHGVLKDQLYSVDDITADDLMTDDFVNAYDNCKTSCGSAVLNHWIRSIKNKDQILDLQKDMKTLANTCDQEFIEKCLKKYSGKQKSGNFVRDIWDGFSFENWIVDKFYFLFFTNLLCCTVLSVLFSKFIFLFIVLFFFFNFIFFIATNNHISHIADSLGYFFSLCYTLKKIQKKCNLNLSVPVPDFKRFKKLVKYTFFFKEGIGGPSSGDIVSAILDYFRIFFAMELFAFKRTQKRVLKNMEEVKKIYLFIGYIDCLLNSNRIMENCHCCFSEFSDSEEIDFANMNHPLLENSVGQTRGLKKNLIVTGLNMSGKTTFMKSLGLNQILATSFGFCFADHFKTSVFNVLSSICINDELLNGKSRYYAEAERLIEIKENISKNRCLCLVDEILSGTNSEERIFGSILILKEFAKQNSLLIAATHDTQIAESLKDLYESIYFDGEIVGDKIIFDYKIKEGIVSKRNGLLLLKLLGIDVKIN